jgi:hypothetical protein
MFFALCPGPFFSLDELFELLMSAASFCSLPVLVALALLKCADARRRRLADEYSIRPDGRRT